MDENIEQAHKKRKNNHETDSVDDNTVEYDLNSEIIDSDQSSFPEEDMISFANMRCPLYGKIKRIIETKRNWWYTDFGKHQLLHPMRGLDFTVLSYNVLSQTLLENHNYLYSRCTPEHLTWNYRSRNLLREIDKYNADIMCLQEVEEIHYDSTFLPHVMKNGYSGVYKKKTGNAFDGCAIFFKNDIFSLVEKLEIDFNKSTTVNVLDRNNIALIVILKPINPLLQHLKLICATTHLLFNPRRGDVKIAQLRLLLATLEKIARKNNENIGANNYHPVIFCGDMNSEPFYPLYDFIVRGYIKYANVLSGNISGQREGFNRGKFMTEESLSLMPLGINQNTCYDVCHLSESNKSSSLPLKNLENIDVNPINESMNIENINSCSTDQSEYFFHPLNFTTAYKHLAEDGEPEVTITLNNQLCTVDYIFYSVSEKVSSWQKDCSNEEGILKHVGCYGLLSESTVKNCFDLPNSYLSSDHFSLLSRFLLTDR